MVDAMEPVPSERNAMFELQSVRPAPISTVQPWVYPIKIGSKDPKIGSKDPTVGYSSSVAIVEKCDV